MQSICGYSICLEVCTRTLRLALLIVERDDAFWFLSNWSRNQISDLIDPKLTLYMQQHEVHPVLWCALQGALQLWEGNSNLGCQLTYLTTLLLPHFNDIVSPCRHAKRR